VARLTRAVALSDDDVTADECVGAEVPEPDSTPGDDRQGEEPDDPPVLRSTRLPAASTSTLRSSLDGQEARAAELRDALDALRASLEGRRAPVAPSAPPPRRSRRVRPLTPLRPGRVRPARSVLLAGAALLGLAGVAVAAVALVPTVRRTATGPSASRAAVAPSTLTPSPPPSASTAAPSPGRSPIASTSTSSTLTTRRLPWPGGAVLQPSGLAASGPGATVPGLDLTAALDPDGRHVDVYERLVLRPGVTSLALHQADLGRLPAQLHVGRGGVGDLQVELDGRAVRPQHVGASWRAEAPDGGTITRAVLRYRLTGVFLRQAPAPPGRFTLVLRPLAAGPVLGDRDPVVVRINDVRIGTMTCPTSRHPLCASVTGRTHTARLPADATGVVVAQVARRR
jgi:hypothetical protein